MTDSRVKTRSRAKNSLRNTLFAAIAYMTKMLLQFVVRAVFIRYFVREYLGINGLFTNVLHVLSLAELGIGNAIVYSMYKPIADNDVEKVKSLVRLYRNMYLIIAAVVTAIGLALIPALPYLIKDVGNIDLNLTVVYLLFLAHTVVAYFFAYRRSLVFAYQRNDIESKVSFFAQLILAAAEILIIIFWKNFYAYTAASVICYALDALIVFLLSYKLFPDIRGKAKKLDKADTHEIAKNTGAMVFHKLGSAVVFSTDSIIISAFIGAAVLGAYSNYTLVTTALGSIINLVMTASKSSVGNLIAKRSPEEAYKIFNALHLAMMWLVSFMTIGAIVCFQDFIRVYTGKAVYLLDYSTVILLCISFYLTRARTLANSFKECAGLFWNDRFKPLFESVLNLGLDFLLVHYMGINGVIVATIISTIAAPLWVEPYVLYKNYFKKSLGHYFARFAVYTAVAAAVCAATFGVCYLLPTGGAAWFVLKFAICLVLPNLLFFAVYFRTPEMRYLIGVAKRIVGGKKRAPEQSTNGALVADNAAMESAATESEENTLSENMTMEKSEAENAEKENTATEDPMTENAASAGNEVCDNESTAEGGERDDDTGAEKV